MSALRYNVALLQVPGIGNQMARTLISYLGSAEAVFKANKAQLLKVPGIGQVLANAINEDLALKQADLLLEKAAKQQDDLVFFTDEAYPQRMRQVHDAPLLLYVAGADKSLPLGDQLQPPRTIAIVGTRQATDYGKRVTEELVEALAGKQVTVVSGLAYGIDAAAHKASLSRNVPTWAVMGTGLDIIYPSQHRTLAQQIRAQQGGMLLTELDYGTKPDGHQFPARNRIIAALADIVVVVEAASTGGALITADIAQAYDREVMAVPGHLFVKTSEGCNDLIARKKTTVYRSPQSLLDLMQWHDRQSAERAEQLAALPDTMPADHQHILKTMLTKADFQIDELARHANVPVNQLASALLALEFDGWIRTMPGKKFALARKFKDR